MQICNIVHTTSQIAIIRIQHTFEITSRTFASPPTATRSPSIRHPITPPCQVLLPPITVIPRSPDHATASGRTSSYRAFAHLLPPHLATGPASRRFIIPSSRNIRAPWDPPETSGGWPRDWGILPQELQGGRGLRISLVSPTLTDRGRFLSIVFARLLAPPIERPLQGLRLLIHPLRPGSVVVCDIFARLD